MRKFGNFLRALFRALKTTVKIPVVLATGAVAWVWDVIAGGPVSSDENQEVVEIPDAAATLATTVIDDAEADRKEKSA